MASCSSTVKLIDSNDFHTAVKRMRSFFEGRGFIEVHTQSRLSILDEDLQFPLIIIDKFGLCLKLTNVVGI